MFPVNNYTLELNYSVEKSFELIKINTSESSSLSTHITNKMLIDTFCRVNLPLIDFLLLNQLL